MVLEATVQIDASLLQLAIFKFLALCGKLGAIALNRLASAGEFRAGRDHDCEEREEGDVLQEELHGDGCVGWRRKQHGA